MSTDKKNTAPANTEEALPLAGTGNASNPSIHIEMPDTESHQLLGKEAEKYLREAGNIEDMPDATDEAETDKAIDEQK